MPERITTDRLLEHADFVRRLARELAGEPSLADDVSQEVWARALQRPPRSGARLRAWLAEVTRNVVRQLHRSEARRQRRERLTARSPHPGPNIIAERAAVVRLIAEIVERLDEPYRTAIFLRFYEGLSPQQIAERLDLNASTVRSHLRRGLARIRGELDRAAGGREGWLGVLALGAVDSKAASSAAVIIGGGALVKAKVGLVALMALLIAGLVYWMAHETVAPLEAEGELGEGAILEPSQLGGAATASEAETQGRLATMPREEDSRDANTFATRIVGRCVDTDGEPVANAAIAWDPAARYLDEPEGVRSTGTDASGRFEWTIPIDSRELGREVPIRVLAEGKRAHNTRCWAPVSSTIWLRDIVLKPGGAIAGIIVSAQGHPLPDADVIARPQQDDGDEEREDAAWKEQMIFGPTPLGFRRSDYPTATADTGRFRVTGLEPGIHEVWATAEGMIYASKAVLVKAGEATGPVSLTLLPVPPAHLVRGLILSPEGRPVPNATALCFQSPPGGGSRMTTEPTNARGWFDVRVAPNGLRRLEVEDPEGHRWRAIRQGEIPAGSDLVFQFEALRQVHLEVFDSLGNAVRPSRIVCESSEDEGNWQRESVWRKHQNRGEPLTIGVPEGVRVRFEIQAAGHDDLLTPARLGDEIPDRLRLEMNRSPRPVVRGQVTATDRPVAGGWVYLFKVHRPDVSGKNPIFSMKGFPLRARVATSGWRSDSTDANGRFELPLYRRGEYVLVAVAVGYARSELQTVEVVNQESIDGIRLELTAGGSLSGAVSTADGSDPTGLIVVAANEIGLPESTRVAPDGSYRFEHLAPGDYRVEFHDRPVVWWKGPSQSRLPERRAPDLEPNVVISEGKDTRHDLEWGSHRELILEGSLRVVGLPSTGWSARLRDGPGGDSPGLDVSPIELDADGRFRLSAPWRGKYDLILRFQDDATSWRIETQVELLSPQTDWRLAVETGTVRGTTDPPSNETVYVRSVRKAEPRISVLSSLRPDGSFSVVLPIGHNQLSLPDHRQGVDLEPGELIELSTR